MTMPAKKKPARRPTAAAQARRAKSRIQKTWKETQAALSSAEATVEKRVKALVKSSGVDTRQATATFNAWRARLERERKKALKQVETRLAVLQTRARKERKALGRTVDEAVQRTLAALNIPSRQEIHELGKRVEELSRKVDRFRR
jgi:polyhydroxyalkanoate synthesis regulator phasin